MRIELSKKHNIRVTCVQPGAVETELYDQISDPAARQQMDDLKTQMEFLEGRGYCRDGAVCAAVAAAYGYCRGVCDADAAGLVRLGRILDLCTMPVSRVRGIGCGWPCMADIILVIFVGNIVRLYSYLLGD